MITVLKQAVNSIFLALLSAFIVMPSSVSAQGGTTTSAVDTSKRTDTATSAVQLPDIRVTDVYRLGDSSTSPSNKKPAGIGDIIVVKVKGLKYVLQKATCVDTNGKPIPGCNKQEVRLFIEGRIINDILPESGAPQEDEGELQYHLQRNTQNDEAWADILGSPKFREGFTQKRVKISVGLQNEYAISSNVSQFPLTRIRKSWFWISFVGLLVYFVILFVLSRKSNLLRDRQTDVSVIGLKNPTQPSPYSLGRFQIAFWFSLVLISFLFIWLITGAYDIITPGVLGLIGISAGTSLGATMIDDTKDDGLLKQSLALQEESNSIAAELTDLSSQLTSTPIPPNATELQTSMSLKKARQAAALAEFEKNKKLLAPKTTSGFLMDILSDGNGVSFHRLQMFIWTFTLGLIFIYAVWSRLSMPELSATLLALQGITAGTYLGLKIPEKQ